MVHIHVHVTNKYIIIIIQFFYTHTVWPVIAELFFSIFFNFSAIAKVNSYSKFQIVCTCSMQAFDLENRVSLSAEKRFPKV